MGAAPTKGVTKLGPLATMSAHEQLNWRPSKDRNVCKVNSSAAAAEHEKAVDAEIWL